MQKRSALLVLRPHLKSSGNDNNNNNAQAVFDANNCAECLKYVVHAKKSHDKDIYSFHPEMFDWKKVGSNKWTVSLQLQGDIMMLHNESYHVTCCHASSSHSYLALQNLFQPNAPKRRCVASLSPLDEKKWCSLVNDVDASSVKAVQDSLTPLGMDSVAVLSNIKDEKTNDTEKDAIIPTNPFEQMFYGVPNPHKPRTTLESRGLKTLPFLDGLLLPNEVIDLIPNLQQRQDALHAGLQGFCQRIRMLNAIFDVYWDGVLIVVNNAAPFSMFVEICYTGELKLCETQYVTTMLQNVKDVQWKLVYAHQILLHQNAFCSVVDLKPKHMFFDFDINTCNVDVLDPNPVAHKIHVAALTKALDAHKVPFGKRLYVFTAEPNKWYLCNIQGHAPSCLVLTLPTISLHSQQQQQDQQAHCCPQQQQQPVFDTWCLEWNIFPVHVVKRNANDFAFDKISERMSETQRVEFVSALSNVVLSGWSSEAAVLNLNNNTPLVFNPKTMRCPLDNKSALAHALLTYMSLSVDRKRRCQISSMRIDLLRSELVLAQFHVHRAKLLLRGIDANPTIMFHGVRAPDVCSAVNDIIQQGFNAKHAQQAAYGGGGIYCSPQLGCGLQYVKHPLGSSDKKNYVFMCLSLPGVVRSGGSPNEPMAPDQNSWFKALAPFTVYCVEKEGLLPFALIQLD